MTATENRTRKQRVSKRVIGAISNSVHRDDDYWVIDQSGATTVRT
jgi:hypothetical protein